MDTAAGTAGARQRRSADDVDALLRTTSTRGWWALATVIVIVGAAGLWSVLAWVPLQTSFTATVNAEDYTMQVTAPARGTLALEDAPRRPDVTSGDILGSVTDSTGASVPIVAPVSGTVTGDYGQPGQLVDEGELLARILMLPDPAQGIGLVSYLPASQLRDIPVGSAVQATIEDPATGLSHEAAGTVVFLGSTPVDEGIMSGTSLSNALVQQWLAAAGGTPYSVGITIPAWDATAAGFIPRGGQIASITRTYGQAHPLSIILGGGR